jgi:hypothetical protein
MASAYRPLMIHVFHGVERQRGADQQNAVVDQGTTLEHVMESGGKSR